MPRKKHPKKDIEDALQYAEQHGWIINVGGSHARQIKRVVDNCTSLKNADFED